MAIIKCKMCGGDLALTEGSTIALCEYCGTQQTVPTADDEKKLVQFERADRLRRQCEFDKAAGIYESIVADFRYEAEAYWGLVLCKYGIEYVTDPASGKKMPTCHRSSFDSVLDDANFDLTLENADAVSLQVYRQEAKQIETIRRGIVEVSSKEEPYDIFICYKETDENGDRTVDSLIAQEIYDALTDRGYQVFFSRITLEDKLGVAYEPYIFAALHSARIMLAVGTKYEHYNAVWVKNEWSRYLKMMTSDKEKHLIPCYKDLDAYDIPREFAHLQAQNMGKVGAMADLLRGIDKLLNMQKPAAVAAPAAVSNTGAVLRRGMLALEDGDWITADKFFEEALNQDAECAEAYLGKLMAELHVKKREQLQDYPDVFNQNQNYQKAFRFGDQVLKQEMTDCTRHISQRNEEDRLQQLYRSAKASMDCAKTEDSFLKIAFEFQKIKSYRDSAELESKCRELAEIARKDDIYERGLHEMARDNETGYRKAKSYFVSISGWADADEKAKLCRQKVEECQLANKEAELKRIAKKKKRRIITWSVVAPILVVIGWLVFAKIYGYAINPFNWSNLTSVSAGDYTTAAVKGDGTVVVNGMLFQDYDVDNWKDIIDISCDGSHIVGLKSDGTVVATGDSDHDEGEVENWTDIIAISGAGRHIVGLKNDGTVVATGNREDSRCDVENWTDIVAISAAGGHTVGLKSDGTVVATGIGDGGRCDVENWTDIVAVSAGSYHTVGLKRDGTVVAVGDNKYGNCDVGDWTDIIQISAGFFLTVGLKKDGTVVVAGLDYFDIHSAENWTGIVQVSAGTMLIVGLKDDGTAVAVGQNDLDKWGCNVKSWVKTKKKQ